jgi:hypothetical protein
MATEHGANSVDPVADEWGAPPGPCNDGDIEVVGWACVEGVWTKTKFKASELHLAAAVNPDPIVALADKMHTNGVPVKDIVRLIEAVRKKCKCGG